MVNVVADTSTLIVLSNIGRLEILKALFGSILVPKARNTVIPYPSG